MTKQRTHNRRRVHLLRKKDNWTKHRSEVFVNGVSIGMGKLFMHEVRMFKPKQWTDDMVDALKKPIEFTANVKWEV